MNKSEDPDAPKNQRIEEAPHGGRNLAGELIADATESSGQDSDWEASADLTPENADETGVDGYESGPGTFESLPGDTQPHPTIPAPSTR
jgi:hypothetical protein